MKNLIHSDSYQFDYDFFTNPLQNSLLRCFIFLYNIHGKSFRFSCWYDISFIINLCNSEKILQKLAKKKKEFSLYDGTKTKYRHNHRPATLVSSSYWLCSCLHLLFTVDVHLLNFSNKFRVCGACVFSVNSTKLKSRGQKKNILIRFSVAALQN